jgi:predicted nucleotidyltransferase
MTSDNHTDYNVLVNSLAGHFDERLKLIVLFGSRSRGEARLDSDHDIFVVIEGLPQDPLARQREVMAPLLPELLRLPARLSVIGKTPQELLGNLTPLVVDICIDGTALYGQEFFGVLRAKVRQALHEAGLQHRRLAGAWMWMFPTLPEKEWAVTWEGYRERA